MSDRPPASHWARVFFYLLAPFVPLLAMAIDYGTDDLWSNMDLMLPFALQPILGPVVYPLLGLLSSMMPVGVAAWLLVTAPLWLLGIWNALVLLRISTSSDIHVFDPGYMDIRMIGVGLFGTCMAGVGAGMLLWSEASAPGVGMLVLVFGILCIQTTQDGLAWVHTSKRTVTRLGYFVPKVLSFDDVRCQVVEVRLHKGGRYLRSTWRAALIHGNDQETFIGRVWPDRVQAEQDVTDLGRLIRA
ncbi:MAG: hypothetical protein AAFX99_17580 [Myxococcota bacterium]